jgi:hypothetical protein
LPFVIVKWNTAVDLGKRVRTVSAASLGVALVHLKTRPSTIRCFILGIQGPQNDQRTGWNVPTGLEVKSPLAEISHRHHLIGTLIEKRTMHPHIFNASLHGSSVITFAHRLNFLLIKTRTCRAAVMSPSLTCSLTEPQNTGVNHHPAGQRQSISSSMNTLQSRKQACNNMDQRNSRKDQRLRNKPDLHFLQILLPLLFWPLLWNLYFQS